ncbi:glycerol dehydrogenase [Escherichia coli KTE73]|nr:glycerol dehydrogenase [Escherichia coli KTE73]
MLKVIQSPAKYLQGPDAAMLFGEYAKNLADSFFVIADDFVMGSSQKTESMVTPVFATPILTINWLA